MMKTIAILTQKGSLSKGVQNNTTVNLFKLEEGKVKEVENVQLEDTGNNYFSLLMAVKKVSLIYAESISSDLNNMLRKLGIITMCKDEIENDQFINQFIF